MRNNCPTNDLLSFIKEALNNHQKALPQNLIENSKNCEECSEILANPEEWEAFLAIHESTNKQELNKFDDSDELKEGQICRIKIPNSSNSAFILITDTSSLKSDGYIRVSPIFVSPFESDIDSETDISIAASKMPTGLPSLIEWWNDRPVTAKDINRVYGSLTKEDYDTVKERLVQKPKPKKLTKSIITFREIEKNKGNQISASFFEKFFANEKIENKVVLDNNVITFNKPKSGPITIIFPDLFPANEELKIAAASSDVYSALKDYLGNNYPEEYKATRVNDGSESFTIESKNKKVFSLIITDKKGNQKVLKSNAKGKLYLKEGLTEFEKIEFKQ